MQRDRELVTAELGADELAERAGAAARRVRGVRQRRREAGEQRLDLLPCPFDRFVRRGIVAERAPSEAKRADVERAHPGRPLRARPDGELRRAAADVAHGDALGDESSTDATTPRYA